MKIRKAERISADHHPGAPRGAGDQASQRSYGERHASGGRGEARPGHVHEHGAAASGDPRGSSHQPSSPRMRRTGSCVLGRATRSARHHTRRSRKVPRGVPPSPSRLLARMPPRPSATGRASGPANSQPRVRWPGFARTRIVLNVTLRMGCKALALLCPNAIPECCTLRKAAGLWPYIALGDPEPRCPTAARS